MAEVVVSTPELAVLGGPASIQVDTSFGSAGSRGTFVMFGPINPNNPGAEVYFIETPLIFDLFIQVDSSSPDYLQVYQYVVQDGVEQWVPTIKLTPNFYGTNRVITFIDGVAELDINIFEIGLEALTAGAQSLVDTRFQFSVQATLSNYEVSSESDEYVSPEHLSGFVSVKVDDIYLDETDEELKLPLTFYGTEFNGTSMQAIDNKNVVVHLSILVVSPNEVIDFFEEGAS
jgi:hypothetical protein